MDEQMRDLCEKLIKAVNVMMDVESSQTYRLEALQFIEDFREKSPLCVECGLQLADKSQTPVVRHLGLQILEHVVKFRWNNMSQQEKLLLKNCTMNLLSEGTHPILQEESHVKDALSRIVVEMIKREWPQYWPDMLKEMEVLAAHGEAQTELVMLVLLRLAEDVITFQTLPTQRRRDIQQTLTQNMNSIFNFLLSILQLHLNHFHRAKCVVGLELMARGHLRVCVSTLSTLAGFIDWVALPHLSSENCALLEILCLLLSEPELQLEAAECLLIACSRKGKLEERKPFMVLFEEVAMNCILSAAQYTFLKRLCQVLCALGAQVCSLVGSNVDVQVPVNMNKYLEALLSFTTHPSQFLKASTQMTWGNIFRHEILSKDPVVSQTAIRFLTASRSNLVKTGFPSKNDGPACDFSRVDFDSDEDFNYCFNSSKAQQGIAIRMTCNIVPVEAVQIAREWMQHQINTPIDTGGSTSETERALCTPLSPSVVHWEAMTFFIESVFGQLLKILDKEKLPIDVGMELLQMVVNYETRDPLILSSVLTIISTLFPFVTHRPHFLPQVIFKIFPAVTFEEECKGPRTRAVKNVRRHACSSLVRFCRDFSELMLPCFSVMYEQTKSLFSNESLLTPLEKCALTEALILISNQFKDYQRQKAFVEELMAPVRAQWLSEEMKCVFWDPACFVAHIGADQEINATDGEDPRAINRSRISYYVYTILGVMKRACGQPPPDQATAGDVVVGSESDGTPIYKNPSADSIQAVLPNFLALLRTLNSLFLPQNVALLSKTFSRANEITEVEKNGVLGIFRPVLESVVYRNISERMQGFLATLYESCYHLLGNAGPSLHQDFYGIEGLAEQIIGSVFINLDSVPDYRLRPLQLVMSCPPQYHQSLLCPLLAPLFSFLLQRLNVRWHIINQRTSQCGLGEEEEEEAYEENHVTQEMVEEQILRQLTREVMDLLSATCITRKLPELAGNREEADGEFGIVSF
ncbi:hypothetical protein DNTS_007636, partial [Danionella cerebrum]